MKMKTTAALLALAAALLAAPPAALRAAPPTGTAYAWGDNADGQLGDGTTTRRNAPVAVTGLGSSVTAMAAGGDHSLAIQNGAAYAWGLNYFGQLGDGTTTQRNAPVAVTGLGSGVTAVAGGTITAWPSRTARLMPGATTPAANWATAPSPATAPPWR